MVKKIWQRLFPTSSSVITNAVIYIDEGTRFNNIRFKACTILKLSDQNKKFDQIMKSKNHQDCIFTKEQSNNTEICLGEFKSLKQGSILI